MQVHRSRMRHGALYSTVHAIENSAAGDEDVVIILDGDDWLPGVCVCMCVCMHVCTCVCMYVHSHGVGWR